AEAGDDDQLATNITYLLELDEVKICHLGNLGSLLTDEDLEKLGKVDVALVPVGGENLKLSDSAELVRQLDPRFVIPMTYSSSIDSAQPSPTEQFMKEMGMAEASATAKLSVQANASGEVETRLVQLEAQL
ncbi:MAG: MBL fold metallo-hydrolase, partial [Candidatus Dormibacteraceae bacterium]